MIVAFPAPPPVPVETVEGFVAPKAYVIALKVPLPRDVAQSTFATLMLMLECSGASFFSSPGGPCAAAAVARDTTNKNAANILVTGNLLVDPRLEQKQDVP